MTHSSLNYPAVRNYVRPDVTCLKTIFFQGEEIQFARINYYRKQYFSEQKNRLGLSFGDAMDMFFGKNLVDEIYDLIKELRKNFDRVEISYNSSNNRGDAAFKINKFVYGNPGMNFQKIISNALST